MQAIAIQTDLTIPAVTDPVGQFIFHERVEMDAMIAIYVVQLKSPIATN